MLTRLVLIGSVVAALALAQQDLLVPDGKYPEVAQQPKTHMRSKLLHEKIKDVVWGIKGIVLGLQQGLLNDERIRLSDKCFGSDEINNDLLFISEFASRQGKLVDAIKFTQLSRDLIINELDNCRFTATIGLLQDFCG